MIKIFDKPEYMTVEEIMEKFYPVSVVIANCKVEYHAAQAGYVMAAETVPIEDFDELDAYADALLADKAKYGKVDIIQTKDPAEGESVFVEFAEQYSTETDNQQDIFSYLSQWEDTKNTA